MRRFVLKIIYLSLPILVVAIIMEILLRNIPNDYLLKKEYLDKNAPLIETLILGNSHSYYGLDPLYFTSNTFNASHISQSLNFDYEILKKYKDKLNKLETIILPVSYFTLIGKLEASSESWRVKNYIIYYGLNSSKSLTDYSEILSNRFNLNIARLINYYLQGRSTITCTQLGWGTSYNSREAKNLIETGETASMRHTRYDFDSEEYLEIFNDNVTILHAIIQWCNENNVKILLLTLPAFETYIHHLNLHQLNTTIKLTNEICSEYDNCTYENMLSDTNFVAIDFYDADHLSEIGAEKLSKRINNVIIGLESNTGVDEWLRE